MLVANPGEEKLYIEVRDSLGFADFTVGTAEVRCLKFANTTTYFLMDSMRMRLWSFLAVPLVLLYEVYKLQVVDMEKHIPSV